MPTVKVAIGAEQLVDKAAEDSGLKHNSAAAHKIRGRTIAQKIHAETLKQREEAEDEEELGGDIPLGFQDTVKQDSERVALLKKTRRERPGWLVLHTLGHMKDTALPAILRNPLFWINVICYAVCSTLARLGKFTPEHDPTATSGSLPRASAVFMRSRC